MVTPSVRRLRRDAARKKKLVKRALGAARKPVNRKRQLTSIQTEWVDRFAAESLRKYVEHAAVRSKTRQTTFLAGGPGYPEDSRERLAFTLQKLSDYDAVIPRTFTLSREAMLMVLNGFDSDLVPLYERYLERGEAALAESGMDNPDVYPVVLEAARRRE